MLSFCPKFIGSLIKNIFPILRKTQLANLSLGVFGLIKSQSGIMSAIVREIYSGSKKHKHRLKRFWRFLSNPRVKPERLRSFWVSWCIRKFTHGKYVSAAVDWTALPGNIQCLMIAVPYAGRAIPLIWQIIPFSAIKDSQNRIEERLIARLNNLLPNGKKLMLTADRGFGRASFIKFLKAKKILFAVRVKSKVWIKIRTSRRSILLQSLYLKPNTPYWFARITFREDEVVTGVNLAAVTVPPKPGENPDPWFLVTNLRSAGTTISAYRKRFDIEEWFKDCKHQLGITNLQTTNLKRVRKLVLIACVSYTLVALIGKPAKKIKEVVDALISKGEKTASIIWVALEAIKHRLLKGQFWKRVWVLGVMP